MFGFFTKKYVEKMKSDIAITLSNLNTEITLLKNDIEFKNRFINELEELLDITEKNCSKLVDEHKKDIASLNEKHDAEMFSIKTDYINKVSLLKKQNEYLSDDINKADSKIADLEVNLQNLKQENHLLRDDYMLSHMEKETVKEQLEKLQAENIALKTNSQFLSEKIFNIEDLANKIIESVNL